MNSQVSFKFSLIGHHVVDFGNSVMLDTDLLVQFEHFEYLDNIVTFDSSYNVVELCLSSNLILISLLWFEINIQEHDVCSILFDRFPTVTT